MPTDQLVYVTAAFGERYHGFARTLIRSFARFMPGRTLHVYSSDPGLYRWPRAPIGVYEASMSKLAEPFGAWYAEGPKSRRNVFKLSVLREMHKFHPDATLVWIDADTIILDDLDRLLVPGRLNAIAHGHHQRQIACGPGVRLGPDEWCYGALYGIPPGPYLDRLFEIAAERPSWPDGCVPGGSGEQVLVNRLFHEFRDEVVYLDRSDTHWWSMRRFVGDWAIPRHPGVPWRGYHRIKLGDDGGLWLEGKRFAALIHNAGKMDAMAANDWEAFRPEVAEVLRGLSG